jgi:hypothetical protein
MADEDDRRPHGDADDEVDDDDEEEDQDDDEEEDQDDDEEEDQDDDEEEDQDDDEEEDELDQLYDERDRLREQVAELEAKLAESRPKAGRWAEWVLGTIAAAACLTLIVVFLGHGFPIPRGESQPDEEGNPAEEEAIFALITEHADEVQSCFDSWAAQSKARSGTIILTLIEVDVGEGGSPERVEVGGEEVPSPLASCLQRTVSSWVFPVENRQFAFEVPFEVRGALPSLEPDTDDAGGGDGSL